MAYVQTMECCGWAELNGVQNYKSIYFHHFLGTATGYSKGAFLFTSACAADKPRSCGATRFARDLRKAELGTVTALPIFKNPNTGRTIVAYLWQVDKAALMRYCKTNKIKEAYGW